MSDLAAVPGTESADTEADDYNPPSTVAGHTDLALPGPHPHTSADFRAWNGDASKGY
jgi:hypothetical protein